MPPVHRRAACAAHSRGGGGGACGWLDGGRWDPVAERKFRAVIAVIIDDFERSGYVDRKSDPSDRRAKLVVPTARGRQMDAADSIVADIMKRHERNLGADVFGQFLAEFRAVIDHQRAATTGDAPGPTPSSAALLLDIHLF